MKTVKKLSVSILIAFVIVLGFVLDIAFIRRFVHRAEYDFIAEAERQLGREVTVNKNSDAFQQRRDDTFGVNGVNTLEFSLLFSRNNMFSTSLELTPVAFGGNEWSHITSVDIIVTWTGAGGGTHTFSYVELNQVVMVPVIPWNAGRYRVLVRANGAEGVEGTVVLIIQEKR